MENGSIGNAGNNFAGIFDAFIILIRVIRDSPTGTVTFAIGILILAICCVITYKAISANPPIPVLWQVMIPLTLVLGVSASMLAVILSVHTPASAKKEVTPEKAIQNLAENAKVNWLIRLIAYEPNLQPGLEVGHLQAIGKLGQKYTFVADYEEFRGIKVSDAIQRLGGSFHNGQHATALIFRIPHEDPPIFPANARGLLQIIRHLDDVNSNDPKFKKFDVDGKLPRDDQVIADIKDEKHINSWSWDSYKENYKLYCQIALRFRCSNPDSNKFSARSDLGLDDDWHPIGFSMRNQMVRYCSDEQKNKMCSYANWSDVKNDIKENFGARAFIIKNYSLSELHGRYMIEFTDPENQTIPSID